LTYKQIDSGIGKKDAKTSKPQAAACGFDNE
jgi:hypothetical protein